ncbi:4947_t:CDS:1, partial [Scutellospora calospora]
MLKLEDINIKEARNLLNHYVLPRDGTEEEIQQQLDVLDYPTEENTIEIRSDEEYGTENRYDQRDDDNSYVHDVEIYSEVDDSETRERDDDIERDKFVSKLRWSDDPSSFKSVDDNPTENNKDVEITNDVASDGSDYYDLPKSRKDYPSEDERIDSALETSLHDSEEGSVTSSPPRLQTVSPKDENTPVQVPDNSIVNIGDVSSLNLSSLNLQQVDSSDLDPNVSKIVNPIVSSIADLKSDFHAELEKFHYRVDPKVIGSMKGSDEWQQTEFEKAQDQSHYDAVITAGKLLDLMLTFILPNEAYEHISQARHILWEKALLYRLTSSTESLPSSEPPHSFEPYTSTNSTIDSANKSINTVNNLHFDENNAEQSTSRQYTKSQEETVANQALLNDEIAENHPDSAKMKETGDRSPVTNGTTKSRRLPNQNRRSNRGRRRSISVQIENSTGSGSKSLQDSTSSRDAERQDDIQSLRLSASPKAPFRSRSRSIVNIPTNNRRFVGFLPSRCFTCGGIGHFANNCPNKGSYITTLSPQQPMRRR